MILNFGQYFVNPETSDALEEFTKKCSLSLTPGKLGSLRICITLNGSKPRILEHTMRNAN